MTSQSIDYSRSLIDHFQGEGKPSNIIFPRYFETGASRPNYERSVVLYEKAGYLAKALDVAIATNQHNALLSISKEITADSGEYCTY